MLFERRTTVVLGLLAALGAASCQNIRTLVNGERFLVAPEGSPRVEIEVLVDPQDSFFAAFEHVGADLTTDVSERVLSLADVGLRFYPIHTDQYGRADSHPPHLMVVRLSDLRVETNDRLVEEEGLEPRVESSVTRLSCSATASIEKRRWDAPSLVISHSRGVGRASVKGDAASEATGIRYRVKRDERLGQELFVSRDDVLRAVEDAVLEALRGTVKAVDRDLATGAPSAVEAPQPVSGS